MLDTAGPEETVLLGGGRGRVVVTIPAKRSPSDCSVKRERGKGQKSEQVSPPPTQGLVS